jgi:hypothetical protein
VLEAMASRNIIIIPKPTIFKYNSHMLINGGNALFANNKSELISRLNALGTADSFCLEMLGESALATIERFYSIDDFINNWNEFFDLSINWGG